MFLADVWNKIKEILKPMIGPRTIEQVLQIQPTISKEMMDSIELWDDMYRNKAPWLKEANLANPVTIKSLGLPSFIASEKARTALIEMNIEITPLQEEVEVDNPNYQEPNPMNPMMGQMLNAGQPKTIKQAKTVGDDTRAKYIDKQFEKVRRDIRRQLEYGVAKGGLVIKPYIVFKDKSIAESNADVYGETDKNPIADQFEFDYVQADGFYPLSFDGSGRVIEAAFIQRRVDKNTIYSRLEYHKLEGTTCTIRNKCYKADNVNGGYQDTSMQTELGTECPLNSVPEWAKLEKEIKIEDVDRLLFAYFRMPEANTIDPYSPLGVSCFSRAVSLIEQADMQYSRMLWEFEGGELAVDVDRDALREDILPNGQAVTGRPERQQRLFRQIDLNAEDTYKVYNPQFRDVSLMNGLNSILMRIEDVVGLSRGTIADVSQEARTATELRILKQRSYASNLDVQKALESALRDVLYIMDVYCDLYDIVPKGDFDVAFEWDDSILVDVETELGKRITLMQNGLASKIETRMWYFNETEAQAQIAMDKIREENAEAIEQNMMAQQDMAMGLQMGQNNQQPNEEAMPEDDNVQQQETPQEPKEPTDKEFRKLSGPS